MFPAPLQMWFSVWFVMLGNSLWPFGSFCRNTVKVAASLYLCRLHCMLVHIHCMNLWMDECILLHLNFFVPLSYWFFFALNISWICNTWISALTLPVFVCTGPHRRQTCTFSHWASSVFLGVLCNCVHGDGLQKVTRPQGINKVFSICVQ